MTGDEEEAGVGQTPMDEADEKSSNSSRRDGLKAAIFSGSRWLLFRMITGIVISGVGLIVIAQLLGPATYGIYSTAFVIWFVTQNLSEFNLDVWIVRRRRGEEDAALGVATLLIALLSLVGASALAVAAPIAADVSGLPELSVVLPLIAPLVVVTGLGQPALSTLERGLRFQAVGLIEVGGQVAFYGVAIALATAGAGLWSLVWALWVQQVLLTATFMAVARSRPRLCWDRELASTALRFGAVATASSVLDNGRTLILQTIVSRYAGAAGAGWYALANRVLEQASFVRQILYRLSVALFGRLRDDRPRLVSALNRALVGQVLAMAPIFLAVAVLGPWLFPLVFGAEWVPVATLLPLLIPTYVLMMTGRLHQSALLAVDRTVPVLLSTAGYVVLLGAAAVPAVAWLGPAGVAAAEAVASIAVAVSMYVYRQEIRLPLVLSLVVCVAALSLAVQTPTLGYGVAVVALVPFLFATVRRVSVDLVRELMRRGARETVPSERLEHVLVVTNDLAPYGAQKVSVDVAGALVEMAPRVTLVTLEKPSETEHPVPPGVVRRGLSRRWRGPVGYIDLLVRFRRLVRRERPDAVLSNMIFSNLVALAATSGVPITAVEHNVPQNLAVERSPRVLRALACAFYPRASWLVGVSDEVSRRTIDAYKLDPKRVRTILNPIDVTEIRQRAGRPSGHPWLSGTRDAPVGVCVGAFRRAKGQDVLLAALALCPGLRMVFVGDGKLLDANRRRAVDLGVDDRADFVGFRRDAAAYMREADVVVVPSRWEGFGLVAAEAGAVGARVVGTDVPGLREVVPALVDGTLVVPDDPRALAEGLQGLPDNPPTSRLDALAPAAVGRRYLDLLASSLAQHHAAPAEVSERHSPAAAPVEAELPS